MRKNDTEQIRLANRRQIIDYLRVHGPIARVDLGQAISLSPATVTAITSDLANEGRLFELPVVTEKGASRGRPRVLIDLKPEAVHVLGVKLSINELRLMLGDQKGKIIKESETSLQTLELSEVGLLEALSSSIRAFIGTLDKKSKPKAIGVAVQGVINGLTGEVVWSPALADKHIQFKEYLESSFKLPVTIANDANCLAIAIRHQPKYQQLQNFCVIMLGYGIGMGMVVNGTMYHGHHGAAAEFGHTKYQPEGAQCSCGKRGCIEAYVSDFALLRDARSLISLPKSSPLHPTEETMIYLVKQADNHDSAIVNLFNRAGHALGYGVANIIALLSPEKVIISGPGVRAYAHMEQGLKSSLEAALVSELINETSVESAQWNEDMTGLGILALALQTID